MALPVERLNADLEGEFRFRGRPVSVPFALPGDLVQFRSERAGRRFRIRPLYIEQAQQPDPGVRRADPFCRNFGTCGGCRGQHLDYGFQLELKAGPVVRAMQERFDVTPEVVGAPGLRAFRNRMDFVVEGEGIGLRPAGEFEAYVPLSSCPVQSAGADLVLALLAELLVQFPGVGFRRGLRRVESPPVARVAKGPVANEPDRAEEPPQPQRESDRGGPLKYATVRSGDSGGMLVLTLSEDDIAPAPSEYEAFCTELIARLPKGWHVTECRVPRPSEVSCVAGGRVLHGRPEFPTHLGGLEFQVPYDAFFQPNVAGFDLILDWARRALAAAWGAHAPADLALIDLYCGVGALGAFVASCFSGAQTTLTGYDFTGSAIAAAPKNLEGRAHTSTFHAVDLNDPPADLFARPADLVIVDPPRAGMSPALRRFVSAECAAPLLLYVSCNPKSQLSDLRELSVNYRVSAACIVDCFPHTGHLEQVVLLRRRGGEREAR